MACNRTIEVHHYHDNELAEEKRRLLESHLRECPECRKTLSEVRRLSSLIAGAAPAEAPAELAPRLQKCWSLSRDRAVLRLASWMTAAAAAILISALLLRETGRTDMAAQPLLWETVAVAPPSEQPEETNPDLVLAQWMAEDLSSENGGLR